MSFSRNKVASKREAEIGFRLIPESDQVEKKTLEAEQVFFQREGKKRGAGARWAGGVGWGVSARVIVDKAAAVASSWWGASSLPAWRGLLRRIRPPQPWPGGGSAAAPGR